MILQSHVALANSEWKEIENDEVLVIFSEPYGYISTSNFNPKRRRVIPLIFSDMGKFNH